MATVISLVRKIKPAMEGGALGIVRRMAGVAIMVAAFPAATAAITTSIGTRAPRISIAGSAFDGTAVAKIGFAILASDPEVIAKAAPPSPLALSLLRKGILAEPLNPTAYQGLALAYRAIGDKQSLNRFMPAALFAYPRSVPLLGLSLELAADNNEPQKAYTNLDRLTILRPTRVQDLMPSVVQYFIASNDDDNIRQVLAEEPLWSSMFFAEAIKRPEALRRLGVIRAGLSTKNVSNPELDATLIKRLTEEGAYWIAWEVYNIQRSAPASRELAPLSPTTQFLPFSWQLRSNEDQTVSLDDRGNLRIDMVTGGSDAAHRTVRLESGNWAFVAGVEREGSSDQTIKVRIECAGTDNELAQTVLNTQTTKLNIPFTVPANGCTFVRIAISSNRSYAAEPTVVTLVQPSITQ